jgi:16S rRNA (cytidine1402-2'-O)-methyltransferase
VSDPGSRLVAAAARVGIPIVPVPGPSALLAALVASGLDTRRFTFFGFLTRSGPERRDALDEIAALLHTAVVYESPNRLAETLRQIEERGGGGRDAVVAREMTKQFEEVRRGTVSELRAYYEGTPPRGELVLVIGGAAVVPPSEEVVRERVRELRAAGSSSRDTAAAVSRELGVPKRVAYRLSQETDVNAGAGDE